MDAFHLPLIHLDTLSADLIPQELDGLLVEGAFLCLQV